MITLQRPAFYSEHRHAEYCGLSTDDLEQIHAHNGDEYYEIDTSATYKYDASMDSWVAQHHSTDTVTSGGDFMSDGTVPMKGNLHMGGHAIFGVKSISDAETGLAIESELSMNNHKITDLDYPSASNDAANKVYVDSKVNAVLPPITASSNGKVLGVVNGTLAWVDKA